MQTDLKCQLCGEIFHSKSGSLKQKFCSKECCYKGRKTGGKKGKHYPHLQRARIGECEICKKEFRAVKDFKNRKQKFCSRKCYEKHWVKNILPHANHRGLKGEDNNGWKGDDVGYSGLHKWVARWKGETSECEHCGTTTAKKFEWCNTDHEYQRNLDDWIRLCTTCHRRYDYENFTNQKAKVL